MCVSLSQRRVLLAQNNSKLELSTGSRVSNAPEDPMQASALAAESEAILRAIMSPDDFGRLDVLSTLLSLPAVFVEPRHDAALFSAPLSLHVTDQFGLLSWKHDRALPSDDWRIKPRTKTVCAVLVMCLNLGIEPPGPPKVWLCPCDHPQATLTTSLAVLLCGNRCLRLPCWNAG
jgi:hypothetical protein